MWEFSLEGLGGVMVMDDSTARPSRRAVMATLAGSAGLPFLARPARTQSNERPPVFQTTRHQFVVVRPPKLLSSVALTDIDGRPARVGPVPGRVLLVNIWATWCEACRIDLPLLERFHATAGRQADIVAVSIDNGDRPQVKTYLRSLAIRSLPVYLDPDGKLAGNAARGTAPLLIYGMPLTYLIKPSGEIAGYMPGVADWLAKDAQDLIGYYAAP